MNAIALAQEIFPDVTRDELAFILWDRTAFPFNDEAGLRQQLSEFRDASTKYPGAEFCEFCNNLALNRGLCVECEMMWSEQTLLLTA